MSTYACLRGVPQLRTALEYLSSARALKLSASKMNPGAMLDRVSDTIPSSHTISLESEQTLPGGHFRAHVSPAIDFKVLTKAHVSPAISFAFLTEAQLRHQHRLQSHLGRSRQDSSIQLLYRRWLTARLVDTVTLSTHAHVSPAIDFKVLSEPHVSPAIDFGVLSEAHRSLWKDSEVDIEAFASRQANDDGRAG